MSGTVSRPGKHGQISAAKDILMSVPEAIAQGSEEERRPPGILSEKGEIVEMESQFSWIEFYTAFATRLLDYKDDRSGLIQKIKEAFSAIPMNLPKLEADGEPQDIDPFSVFALFNKGLNTENRRRVIDSLKKEFAVSGKVPDDFPGVPIMDSRNATFYGFGEKRQPEDIDNLWTLFAAALALAEEDTADKRGVFCAAYDQALKQYAVNWNITMGLYWIRPGTYMNLDSCNRSFLSSPANVPESLAEEFGTLKNPPSGEVYLNLRDECRDVLFSGEFPFNSFPELSHTAWALKQKDGASPEKEATAGTEETPEDGQEEKSNGCPAYTKEDFLAEVFASKDFYDTVTGLLREKKNIILQGAPGVGKTYLARRLAYAMMGRKDEDRIRMVQFHQSYSYEDFIMGYRPTETGFELRNGTFYSFCKLAENDPTKKYFFIIDEINRGNLSRIFGELFMLIEHDKRGEENSLDLLYSGEAFSVPENIFFIGMMNTADRSLAILDYALRRRFAFVDLEPAFETPRFKDYQEELESPVFDKLIECVQKLNEEIAKDDSLGEGFRLGHSFFCNLKPGEATPEKLSRIVEYELIPLLKEYWFDEAEKVKKWREDLKKAINEKSTSSTG